MSNHCHTEVKLVAEFREGNPVYEQVPAVKIGENRYRLTGSPGFAPGVASGDEIALDTSQSLGYRILKRSGNLAIQLFLKRCTADERRMLVEMVHSVGGHLDGGKEGKAGCLLIFTVPVVAGFDTIESVMGEITRLFAVDRWMYGNVYDVRDGVTPLNWWVT